MIWVLRAGKEGMYYDQFLSSGKIFLPWTGYNVDLNTLNTREDFRALVVNEKNPDARTTISNWSAQLYSFCCEMDIGDYVMLPTKRSKEYAFVRITSDYLYEKNEIFHHVRKYSLLAEGIPRSKFQKSTQYSLGAFRTLFKVKQSEEVMTVVSEYIDAKRISDR